MFPVCEVMFNAQIGGGARRFSCEAYRHTIHVHMSVAVMLASHPRGLKYRTLSSVAIPSLCNLQSMFANAYRAPAFERFSALACQSRPQERAILRSINRCFASQTPQPSSRRDCSSLPVSKRPVSSSMPLRARINAAHVPARSASSV